MKNISHGILGLVVGDALGVPVEFQSRQQLDQDPVVHMRAYGTYNQPKGTWSDDSSLALCLADVLSTGYDLKAIAQRFIDWKTKADWTPHGEVFDIGITTSKAIDHLISLLRNGDEESLKLLRYQADEYTNGNGSLMRILPLYLEIQKEGIEAAFEKIWYVSALTHGHIRSAISCLIYLVLVDELMQGKEKATAYRATQLRTKQFFIDQDIMAKEVQIFSRLIEQDIRQVQRTAIKSSGYVLDSLEAAFWCFLNSESYSEAVLKAVNLGEDTDTTAAIAGGLAGVYFGMEGIPTEWLNSIV